MPVDKRKESPHKRIAIAIEMDYAYPWHHGCYQGIMKYAEERGGWKCIVDPFLVGTQSDRSGEPYDGVVGRIDQTSAEIARLHDIPVVNHWANSPAKDLPSVLGDDIKVGQISGEHLLSCGYRRFAFARIRNNQVGKKLIDGLTQAVTAKGFKAPETWFYSASFEEDREQLSQFRDELLDWLSSLKPPTGVAALDATAARYIAQGCYELGLEMPKDIGIIVQSSDYSSDTGSPTITSVERDHIQIGYEAAKLLDELMQGKASHPLQRLLAPTRLIRRDSTDVFVCDDPLVKQAMRYIAEHFRENLKVEDVADAVYTSKSTLRRRFEEVLGRQIKEEITRQRTEHVKVTLIETDKSLAAIANEFGYSSPTQLTRSFSNVVGMTPSEYRKSIPPSDGAHI